MAFLATQGIYLESLYGFYYLLTSQTFIKCCPGVVDQHGSSVFDTRTKHTPLFVTKYILPGLILGLRPANERRRYKVTPSLIGWAQI